MLYQVINGADTGKIKDVAISMKSETQTRRVKILKLEIIRKIIGGILLVSLISVLFSAISAVP